MAFFLSTCYPRPPARSSVFSGMAVAAALQDQLLQRARFAMLAAGKAARSEQQEC
jgi:hypothetical protein